MPSGGPACITCREKCRKCDRTKPVCQRCITKGLECKGYPDKFRFAGLATRGKWKNRAVPTVSRDHAVRTQPGTGIDHPDTSHEESESDQRHPSALPSCEDRNIERLPILDHPWPQSEGRSVELDDLLMLERTELLLAHYDQVICPHQIALPAGAYNPYQVYILPLAYEQIGVLYAVLGLTACHMGIGKGDTYLRETLAVEYRVRAIRCLGETLRNGISGELDENERDGIFVIIQILLLQDIFESGISTHGAHITGALSICNQLRLSDTLCRENERTIFFLGNLAWLDIIRSLADARRLCFSPELRAAVATLSDLKFERVNGCPREIFLIIGNVMEHAKAHATGKMGTAEYERLLNACRYELYSWSLKPDRYPNDNPRWPAVAEAFRHACILHTSRLLDMAQPAEAPIIQKSVTAILDSLAEIPADCRLIELVVMPIFMAGADALSPYARHYLLLRFDHIRSHGGVSSEMSVSLLKSVWNARGRQAKHDSRNIPWVWFTRDSGSERQLLGWSRAYHVIPRFPGLPHVYADSFPLSLLLFLLSRVHPFISLSCIFHCVASSFHHCLCLSVIQNLRGTFTSDISNSSYTWDEMSQATPVRIVLPYREQPFQKPTAIINAFFTWRGIQPLREDYYTHICSDPRSSRLYLVLDLHCKTHPNVDLSNLDLEVFKVSGIDPFTFQDLGEVARKQVRQRSASLEWGEGTHSSQRN